MTHAALRSSLITTLFVALFACLPATGATASKSEDPTVRAQSLRERLGTQWDVVRTPSVRVFVRPRTWPGRAALAAVESELQRLGARMGLDASLLSTLLEDPIDYFLVQEPGLIESFGAGDVEGLAFPENRLIVSTRLPHQHELVHVLMHLALPGRRGGNHPFLQEGLASYLGGNGVDGELTVLAHADRVLAERVVDLPSLWTVSGWRHAPLDAYDRYAVAARFVQYLAEAAGDLESVRELARLLSGLPDDIEARPWSAVRAQLEGIHGCSWEDLELGFARWRAEHPVADVRETAARVRAADLTRGDDRHHVRVWIEPDGWTFAVQSRRGAIDAELFWGEEQGLAPGLAAAPSVGRRFRLEVDEQGFRLTDQQWGRTLLRWEWEETASTTVSTLAPAGPVRERVWTWGNELIDQLTEPEAIGLWSRPVFDPR